MSYSADKGAIMNKEAIMQGIGARLVARTAGRAKIGWETLVVLGASVLSSCTAPPSSIAPGKGDTSSSGSQVYSVTVVATTVSSLGKTCSPSGITAIVQSPPSLYMCQSGGW